MPGCVLSRWVPASKPAYCSATWHSQLTRHSSKPTRSRPHTKRATSSTRRCGAIRPGRRRAGARGRLPEAQLTTQLDQQLAKHAQGAHDWGMATVKRCMEGCVGPGRAKIQELCDCIEFSSDLSAASKCFDASMAGARQPVGGGKNF